MDKKFKDIRPRVVGINDEPNDERWLVEGRIVPRVPFSRGVGAGGFRYGMKIHPNMKARYNSLDDVEGRLKDMDTLGVDVQVVYPTSLAWVLDVENPKLAEGVCRAYNDYIAEQCQKGSDRLKGMALVPLQFPEIAEEELKRAVKDLHLIGVVSTGAAGRKPLHSEELNAFFHTVNALNIPLGFHAVTGMHYTPWADTYTDFFSTHVTAMPFSMLVGMMSMIRSGLMEELPNLRCAFLEIGAGWLPYWSWWVGEHVELYRDRENEPRKVGRNSSNWGAEVYQLPNKIEGPEAYIRNGRILTTIEEGENLRSIIDWMGVRPLISGTDYPHGDMSWTRVSYINELKDLNSSEKAAILGENAQEFYGV